MLLFFGTLNVPLVVVGIIMAEVWMAILFGAIGVIFFWLTIWSGKMNRYAAWRAIHGGSEQLTGVYLTPWAQAEGDPDQLAELARTMDWKVIFGVNGEVAPYQFYRLKRKDEKVFLAGALKIAPDLEVFAQTLDGQVYTAGSDGQLTARSPTPEQLKLEEVIMRMLLEGDDPVLEDLRLQHQAATATSHDYTGVGFFTDLMVPNELSLKKGRMDFEITDVHAILKGLESEVSFVLFIRDGRLNLLEGFTYGEDDWPYSPELIAAYYTHQSQSRGIVRCPERDMEQLRLEWENRE